MLAPYPCRHEVYRDQPRLGVVKKSILRISVVQAGGQWLTERMHMKNTGMMEKIRAQRNALLLTSAFPNTVFKYRVQERPKDPQNYPHLSMSVS